MSAKSTFPRDNSGGKPELSGTDALRRPLSIHELTDNSALVLYQQPPDHTEPRLSSVT